MGCIVGCSMLHDSQMQAVAGQLADSACLHGCRQRAGSPSSQDGSGSCDAAADGDADSPGKSKRPALDELRQKALERMQSK